jgi:methylmalonyl-CoA/ethylmalonyl-CoA epimerase
VAFVDCDGTRLFLSAVENVGDESVLYFRVDDISASYDNLRSRGVEFEDAPHMIFRHESGMEEWMAFFKDLDDHFTAIMAQVGSE